MCIFCYIILYSIFLYLLQGHVCLVGTRVCSGMLLIRGKILFWNELGEVRCC